MQVSKNLPKIIEAPTEKRESLFMEKLEQCCVLFDFSNPLFHLEAMEIKRATLREICEYMKMASTITPNIYPYIVKMLACNLFRSLTSTTYLKRETFEADEDEPVMDAAWPHRMLVYECFICFLTSNEFSTEIAKEYINKPFIIKLLMLFDSEDPRERDHLKTTVHRLYGKFLVYRSFIRKCINNIFHQFVYETERHHGIFELLEILGSIINGFALPLKEEHKIFLMRVLMPLHKANNIICYHNQLAYCVVQFLEKDPSLTAAVVKATLRYWPKVNSTKEVLFLNEIEEILEVVEENEFKTVMLPIFERLATCTASPHFQVAERALNFWNNEYVVSLIRLHSKELLPLMFKALYKSKNVCWNGMIQGMKFNAMRILMQMDQQLFENCVKNYKENKFREKNKKKFMEDSWATLNDLASENPQYTVILHRKRNFSPYSALLKQLSRCSSEYYKNLVEEKSSSEEESENEELLEVLYNKSDHDLHKDDCYEVEEAADRFEKLTLDEKELN
ncbi:serine/threonine-protein phosphatase 2A 56 kDa regulatory subunit epsilon isoform-like isoform X2 [Zophobas morio]|uniref:serine/threonine-protein phosphatase 2A 56 kDa regulatory subunit epsilon isoform-like isoform X2 n=1 Tax=Zophobas morio TaxID=2755281 RepID=UPI003083E564